VVQTMKIREGTGMKIHLLNNYKIKWLGRRFRWGLVRCPAVSYRVTRPLFEICQESVPPLYKWILNLGWLQIIRMN
jgi:hypothetical protein